MHCTQQGSAMSEFLPVALLIIMLALGGLETAHWLFTRQAVSLALLNAARAGSTNHANPLTIAQAFEQGLLPLYTSASAAEQRLQSTLASHRKTTGDAPWRIEILQPSAANFRNYGSSQLPISRQTGLTGINNDYQHEQHMLASSSISDDSNIYQANTLDLRLTYLHKPLLPGLAALLQTLKTDKDNYASNAMRHGLLPMMRTIQLGMESHPLQWQSLPDGRVIMGAADASVPKSSQPDDGCKDAQCAPLPSTPPKDETLDTLPPDDQIPPTQDIEEPVVSLPDHDVVPSPDDRPSIPESDDLPVCDILAG